MSEMVDAVGKPSKTLAFDDPLLRPEREAFAEIGITWVLDQDIQTHPKVRYVRILARAESLLWEESLGKTRIELQTAPLHAWNRTQGEQSRAAVGIFYESDGWTESNS